MTIEEERSNLYEDDPEESEQYLEIHEDQANVAVASFWQLIWWRYRRHRVAVFSTFVVLIFYLIAAFSEFVAPYDPEAKFVKYKLHPPTPIHIVDADGNWHMPFIYQTVRERDPKTYRNTYTEDTTIRHPIRLFSKGEDYKLWGEVAVTTKLFGLDVPHEEQGVFLMGTDRLGRDMVSRVSYGARLSLSIGLIGVIISLVLGILLGGLSGYYGGMIDNIIQRIIEFLRSIPSIPLWMGLSAALPPGWPILYIYLSITIHSLLYRLDRDGARCARQVPAVARGRVCDGGPVFRQQRIAHHPASYAAFVYEPHHRRHDPVDPNHDSERNRSQFPWTGSAPAGNQLGRAAARGAEHQRSGHRPLDDGGAGPHGGDRGDGVQLYGRRDARRRRPLRFLITKVSGSRL